MAAGAGAVRDDVPYFEALRAQVATGHATGAAATELAELAQRLDRPAEALDALGRVAGHSPAARREWALLALASGRTDLIASWFADGGARPRDAALLRDLYYRLSEAGDVRLAVEAARRLHTVCRSDAVVFGRAREAIDAALVDEAALIYDAALYAALRLGLGVAEEAREVFEARLAEPGLADAHRQMLEDGLRRAGAPVRSAVVARPPAVASRRSGDVVDPAAQFALGELAREHGQALRAREHFARARDLLVRGAADVSSRALLARVLVRLGEVEQASAVFDGLLRTSPALDGVRADYGTALIESGDWARAADVLGLDGRGDVIMVIDDRPADPAGGRDADGTRRLDLLRVRWLTEAGRHREAARILDRVTVRFPDDADVLAARGVFEAERGWFAQARAHDPLGPGLTAVR